MATVTGSSWWTRPIRRRPMPLTGWPKGSRGQNAFNDSAVRLTDATPRQFQLPAYGVVALRFSKQ